MSLLERVQTINIFFKENIGQVALPVFCSLLVDEMNANVFIIDTDNVVLSHAKIANMNCELFERQLSTKSFPLANIDQLLSMKNVTTKNINGNECVLSNDFFCEIAAKSIMIIPITVQHERVASVVLARYEDFFSDDEQLLGEVVGTLLSIEFLFRQLEVDKQEARKNNMVEIALDALSYSEAEAARHVFNELDGTEGFLVASRIADKAGITRSVIVNALRKLESAGVIESRSLGMKGTYIKVLNDKLLEQLNLEG